MRAASHPFFGFSRVAPIVLALAWSTACGSGDSSGGSRGVDGSEAGQGGSDESPAGGSASREGDSASSHGARSNASEDSSGAGANGEVSGTAGGDAAGGARASHEVNGTAGQDATGGATAPDENGEGSSVRGGNANGGADSSTVTGASAGQSGSSNTSAGGRDSGEEQGGSAGNAGSGGNSSSDGGTPGSVGGNSASSEAGGTGTHATGGASSGETGGVGTEETGGAGAGTTGDSLQSGYWYGQNVSFAVDAGGSTITDLEWEYGGVASGTYCTTIFSRSYMPAGTYVVTDGQVSVSSGSDDLVVSFSSPETGTATVSYAGYDSTCGAVYSGTNEEPVTFVADPCVPGSLSWASPAGTEVASNARITVPIHVAPLLPRFCPQGVADGTVVSFSLVSPDPTGSTLESNSSATVSGAAVVELTTGATAGEVGISATVAGFNGPVTSATSIDSVGDPCRPGTLAFSAPRSTTPPLEAQMAIEVSATPAYPALCPQGVPDGTSVTFVLVDTDSTGAALSSLTTELSDGTGSVTLQTATTTGSFEIEATASDGTGGSVSASLPLSISDQYACDIGSIVVDTSIDRMMVGTTQTVTLDAMVTPLRPDFCEQVPDGTLVDFTVYYEPYATVPTSGGAASVELTWEGEVATSVDIDVTPSAEAYPQGTASFQVTSAVADLAAWTGAAIMDDDYVFTSGATEVFVAFDKFIVFDVSPAAALSQVGVVDVPEAFSSMARIGDWVYGCGAAGLHTVSVADPTVPVLSSAARQDVACAAVAADATRVFVAEGANLVVYTGGSNGTPTLAHTVSLGAIAKDVSVLGNTAVVATEAGISVLDISGTGVPSVTSSIAVGGAGAVEVELASETRAFALHEYCAGSDIGDLYVVDLTDPSDPIAVPGVGIDGGWTLNLRDLVARGDHAFGLDTSNIGMRRFDMSRDGDGRSYPAFITSFDTPRVLAISPSGNTAAVFGSETLQLVDLSQLDWNSRVCECACECEGAGYGGEHVERCWQDVSACSDCSSVCTQYCLEEAFTTPHELASASGECRD